MKQKLTALLLVLCMVMAFVPAMAVASAAENTTGSNNSADTWDGATFTEPTSGTGTADDPILLTSAAEFMWFRNKLTDEADLDLCYKLTVNVNFKVQSDFSNASNYGTYQSAIGVTATTFSGTFDGDNHIISNMACDRRAASPALFGTVAGTVKNITLDNATFDVYGSTAAGICAFLTAGGIENCHVTNSKIQARHNAGGIVAKVQGSAKIENSSVRTGANGFVKTSAGTTGGIVSEFDALKSKYDNPFVLTIQNCQVDGTIGDGNKSGTAGGIVGLVNSTYEDKTSAGYPVIENALNIVNCSASATVASKATSGALIGKTSVFKSVNIRNCVNMGSVISAAAAGGLVGVSETTSARRTTFNISSTVNYGAVTGTTYVGGFIAGNPSSEQNLPVFTIELTRCAQMADVTGGTYVGGFVGAVPGQTAAQQSITAIGCYIRANVKSTGTEDSYAGLVVGNFISSINGSMIDIKGALLMGTVSAGTGAGAIAGNAKISAEYLALSNNYFFGVSDLKLVSAGLATTEQTAADADFTGTTVLDALNAAAKAAGLPEDTWVKGKASGKPELRQFCTDPVEEPSAPEITIDGASLTIGENVTLNLFVKTETIRNAGVTVKTISIVNNAGDPAVNGVLRGTNYVFTISGISASEFGTNKIYHVQYTTADAPGTPIDCTATKEYSPLQYAINMYGKTDKAGLDALLLSIVNYADAAAGTTTAKAAFDEKHAGADWTAVTALTEIVKEDKDSGSYSYDAKTMPRIGASLTETIELTVYLKDTAYTGVTMKVGDTELTGTVDESTQTVKFEGFWATDLYNEITLTFTGAEGTEPLKATTSLVQYLNRYAGNETYAKVATATAQYLYAARNFCLKNRTNA